MKFQLCEPAGLDRILAKFKCYLNCCALCLRTRMLLLEENFQSRQGDSEESLSVASGFVFLCEVLRRDVAPSERDGAEDVRLLCGL